MIMFLRAGVSEFLLQVSFRPLTFDYGGALHTWKASNRHQRISTVSEYGGNGGV